MINSREFAAMLGISQSTVSRAMNNSPLVPLEKRQYIQKMAGQYGFALNNQARGLKTRKTGIIGILFPTFFESLSKNMMFAYVYDVVQRELIKSDYDIMMVYDYDEQAGMNAFERIVKSQKVDGFITLRSILSERDRELIEQYHIPCVAVYNAQEEGANFLLDGYDAGRQAGEFFGELRDYHYGYVTVPVSEKEAQKRLNGLKDGLSRRNKTVDPDRILECSLSMEAAYRAVMGHRDRFMEGKSAMLVYNDMMAIGVVNALKDLGIPVPGQVQVIGMDDLPIASWIHPSLSTLHAPIYEMVHSGCSILYQMIHGQEVGPVNQSFRYSFIHRETTEAFLAE
ncbi:LacI family transcriptional regulator [Caproiciproducens sp. NJN-50]|uniref:LacI family DNA-binding transcriptional regulator n=1 Tax=Caproiciproducens sp. NJN-50 TaxID=2507162 RepID=UPI000FFE1578|nr:LacI family DNA-binding transcriptional regulator [Caproiciproducens sp. NJN-50]QAT48670.1 LacI family transcriptional regulator [Caproiciproducens sp. NJN-50]